MILEPVIRFILHCNRCNTEYTDDYGHNDIAWTNQDAIVKAFDSDGGDSIDGWRVLNGRYLCGGCQRFNGQGDVSEKPPLPAAEAAKVVRAAAAFWHLELVAPVISSVHMSLGEEWERYPDPAGASKAVAWAGEFR